MTAQINPPGFVSHRNRFQTTDWAAVTAAGGRGEEAEAAFALLYRDYWFPVYAWFREHGRQPAEAEDLAQEFFLHLLARGALAHADAAKGRFRAFLRGALRYFDLDQSDLAQRQKRGGDRIRIAVDAIETETRYQAEIATSETPDRAFDRRWSETILLRAIRRLKAEYLIHRDPAGFEELKGFLTAKSEPGAYRLPGERLGLSANAVAAVVRRLRRRFAEIVLDEVTRTVGNHSEARDEFRAVLGELAKLDLDTDFTPSAAQSVADAELAD